MSTSADTKNPATYYDLLRLKPLEPDQAVIRKHFHKLVEQVRGQLAKEPGSAKWRQTLADMTRAMLVLSDARRKADYDVPLGGRANRDLKPMDLEKIVRARKLLDDTQLDKAKKFADTVNLDLHEAIINQKLAPSDVVMPLYADSLGVPFVELGDLTIEEGLVPVVPAVMARQNSLVPVMKDEASIIVASPRPLKPEIEEQLQLRFAAPIRQVICTKSAVEEAITKYYSREAAVAQMNNTAPVVSTTSAGGAPAAAAGPKTKLSKVELNQKKRKLAMVAGGFTFMIGVVISTYMGWTGGSAFPFKVWLTCGAIGAIVAGLTYTAVNE